MARPAWRCGRSDGRACVRGSCSFGFEHEHRSRFVCDDVVSLIAQIAPGFGEISRYLSLRVGVPSTEFTLSLAERAQNMLGARKFIDVVLSNILSGRI